MISPTEFPLDPGTFRLFLDPSIQLTDELSDRVFLATAGDVTLSQRDGVCSIVGDFPDDTTPDERDNIVSRLSYELSQRDVAVSGSWASGLNHDGSFPRSRWRMLWCADACGFLESLIPQHIKDAVVSRYTRAHDAQDRARRALAARKARVRQARERANEEMRELD